MVSRIPKLRLSLCLLYVFWSIAGCGEKRNPPPPVVQGYLDTSGWKLDAGLLPLDGEWEFYWKQEIATHPISDPLPSPTAFVPVPSVWKGLKLKDGSELKGDGYASYRAVVFFPEDTPALSLHALDLSSAYRLYVNGQLLHEEGKFSRTEEGFRPSYKPVLLDLPPVSGETEFVLEIANYHYAKGGFWETIEIGERRTLYKKIQRTYQITSFIAGSIFLWGLYHTGLFFMRRNDKASLYLSLFCYFLVLRILTTGERLITDMIPKIDMSTLIRLEFTTFYVATAVYAYFFRVAFPNTMSKRSILIALGAILPFVLSLFLPVRIFTEHVLYFQVAVVLISLRTLWAIIRAYKEDKIGSSLSLFGFLFVFFTLLNDIFYYNNLINTFGMTPFGFLGFILFQGYILSYNYTRAFLSSEKLNSELKTLKEGLEDLVFERTKELQESQDYIHKLNEFAKALNSSLEFEVILQKAYQYLSKMIDCDSLIIFLAQEKRRSIDYFKSVLPEDFPTQNKHALSFLRFPMNERGGFFHSVYQRRRPFRFSKIQEDRLTILNRELISITGNRPGVLLPLLSKGQTVAILLLFASKKNRPFGKRDMQIIESVSEPLATAVVNSLLLENVNHERNLAEIAKIEMENARNEVVKLNEFTKKINSESQLEKIIEDMFDYIQKTFQIEGVILQLIDHEAQEFYSFKTTIPPSATPEQIELSRNLRVPLNQEGGLSYKTYLRKKPLYLKGLIFEDATTELERTMIKTLELKSFFMVPLVVQNEVVAMVYFTSYELKMNLSKNEIQRISGFCDQIAGAVQSSLLLRLAEEERRKVEQARTEIHQLNEFAKKVNSLTDFESILAEIFQYIRDTYQISNVVLYYVDEESQNFRYLNHSGYLNLSENNVRFFKELRIPLQDSGGFVYQCYKKKRHFFMKRIRKSIPNEIDRQIIEKAGLTSLLIAPLINNDQVVAMAMFGMEEGSRLLKDQELPSIIGVCEQIASAINNHFLMSKIEEEKRKSDSLLLNILPANVASELQRKGRVNPVEYENVTMLMTGFPGFSGLASQLSPEELIEGLDLYFSRFDEIIRKRSLEKLKMAGDMYVAAGGLPVGNFTHQIDACLAALEIRDEVHAILRDFPDLPFRPKGITIALHSGPVVAGVIGKTKFSYDVWGKTVTQTQAIRRGGNAVEINVSKETAERINRLFVLDNERTINTYEGDSLSLVELLRLKPNLSANETGTIPNAEFEKLYTQQKRGARILIK